MGRPTKLTDEVQKRICDAIRAGNYLNVAAQYGGIDSRTLQEWMQRGRAITLAGTAPRLPSAPRYVQFLRAVEKAKADAEVALIATIRKASVDQWQAAAWMLERSHPDRWGRRERIEHTGADGGPISVLELLKAATLPDSQAAAPALPDHVEGEYRDADEGAHSE